MYVVQELSWEMLVWAFSIIHVHKTVGLINLSVIAFSNMWLTPFEVLHVLVIVTYNNGHICRLLVPHPLCFPLSLLGHLYRGEEDLCYKVEQRLKKPSTWAKLPFHIDTGWY